jgi:hypothetical protein
VVVFVGGHWCRLRLWPLLFRRLSVRYALWPLFTLGRTQTTDFNSLIGYFSPGGAKNNQYKKKSTMLPQAKDACA